MREQQCKDDCQFFIDKGSQILAYPLKRSSLFYFECAWCKTKTSYLGLSTFMRRGNLPLCPECSAIRRGQVKIENYKKQAEDFIQAGGSKLLRYTKQLEPVTLLCSACKTKFTYSTYNNLLKRNKKLLCKNCRVGNRSRDIAQNTEKYITKYVNPLLREWELPFLKELPLTRESFFLISCFYCKKVYLFRSVNKLLFKHRKDKDFRPTCKDCVALKISETQRKHNAPLIYKKIKNFFEDNGSVLYNKPRTEKSWVEYRCTKCHDRALRKGIITLKKTPGELLCLPCTYVKMGNGKRYVVEGERNQVRKKNVRKYINTWVRRVWANCQNRCIITGHTENLIAHHLYSYTKYPKLSMKIINGVLLQKDLHTEYHSRYTGAAKIEDFQIFYKEKTGRDFYLQETSNMLVDVIHNPEQDLNKHKRQLYAETQKIYIPVFEHELLSKSEIIVSMLKYRARNVKKVFYARECEVLEITDSFAGEFFNKNHLQGHVKAKFNLALHHPVAGIVSVMSFRKPRFNEDYDVELLRFCNLLNYSIPGAASKLFKYFIKKHKNKSIISYCDIRFSHTDPLQTVYSKIGFRFSHETAPNYFYVKNGKSYSRLQFQKHKLLGNPLLKKVDMSKSETENMQANGFVKFTDCGNFVFIYPVNKNI